MGGSGANQSARTPRTGVQACQGLQYLPLEALASEEEEFGAVLPLTMEAGEIPEGRLTLSPSS